MPKSAFADKASQKLIINSITNGKCLRTNLVSSPDAGVVQGVEHTIVGPGQAGSMQGQVCFHLL